MAWSNFQVPKSSIVENSNQCVNFNKECVTHMSFYKVDINCAIFKQALETSLDKCNSTCGSKDVAMRIC